MNNTTVPFLSTSSRSSSTHIKCEVAFNHARELLLFNTYSLVNRITLAVILGILIIPTIILNTIIIIAMVRNRTLWRSATILIGFLALSDAFVGYFSMPLFLSTVITELVHGEESFDSQTFCVSSKAGLNSGDLGMGWSFITISLLTFERYVAIFYPFWYRRHVRTSAIIKITIVLWILWTLVGLVLILNLSFEVAVGFFVLIFVIVVCVLSVPAYLHILCLLNKIEASAVTDVNRPRIDRKGSVTCAIILFCLVLCYTPLVVFAILYLANGGKREILITYMFPWARLLFLSNSFLDPMIYLARNQAIRRAAHDTLRRLFKKKTHRERPRNVVPPDDQPKLDGLTNNVAAVITDECNSKL